MKPVQMATPPPSAVAHWFLMLIVYVYFQLLVLTTAFSDFWATPSGSFRIGSRFRITPNRYLAPRSGGGFHYTDERFVIVPESLAPSVSLNYYDFQSRSEECSSGSWLRTVDDYNAANELEFSFNFLCKLIKMLIVWWRWLRWWWGFVGRFMAC